MDWTVSPSAKVICAQFDRTSIAPSSRRLRCPAAPPRPPPGAPQSRFTGPVPAITEFSGAAARSELDEQARRAAISPGTLGIGNQPALGHPDRLIEFIELDAVDETHPAIANVQIGEPT